MNHAKPNRLAAPRNNATALVPDLLKPSEAAAKLGISVSSLTLLGIPRVRLGYRTTRYNPADILALLDEKKGAR